MSRTRSSWRRWGAALSAFVVVASGASLAVTSAQAQTPVEDEEVTFRVGIQQPIDSLNPYTGFTAVAFEMYQLMYDQLIGYDQNFRPQPLIAEDVPEISDDGLTYTYDIREGIKWSDGEDLTAEDVEYTFNRLLDPDSTVEKVNYGSYVKPITKVEATDDYTVVMTTQKPSPLMDKLAVPILPEHIWSQIPSDEVDGFSNEPGTELGAVGSGPFILEQAKTDEYWELRANPDYYLGAPKIDAVSFTLYKNGQAEVLALQNDEIDFYDEVDADLFTELENTDGITARSSVYYGFNYVTINQGAITVDGDEIGDGHPALADPVVRKAIEYGTDKETLVDRVLDGGGSPGTSIIPPLYSDWHYEPEDPRSYNVETANQMLDDAGYEMGPDGVRVMPPGSEDPGRPLEFRLLGRQNSKSSQQTVEFMKSWLEDIGMRADAKIVSENFLIQVAADGKFDMYEWGWVVEPDPDFQVSAFACYNLPYYNDKGVLKAAWNDAFFCDEEYDKLYEKQGVETDPAARQELIKQMQQMFHEDASYIVTFYYDYLQAYNSDFSGFAPQPEPDGPILFQYGTWGYRNVELASESQQSGSGDSSNTGVIVGVVALAAIGVGAVAWFVSRSRRNADDTE